MPAVRAQFLRVGIGLTLGGVLLLCLDSVLALGGVVSRQDAVLLGLAAGLVAVIGLSMCNAVFQANQRDTHSRPRTPQRRWLTVLVLGEEAVASLLAVGLWFSEPTFLIAALSGQIAGVVGVSWMYRVSSH